MSAHADSKARRQGWVAVTPHSQRRKRPWRKMLNWQTQKVREFPCCYEVLRLAKNYKMANVSAVLFSAARYPCSLSLQAASGGAAWRRTSRSSFMIIYCVCERERECVCVLEVMNVMPLVCIIWASNAFVAGYSHSGPITARSQLRAQSSTEASRGYPGSLRSVCVCVCVIQLILWYYCNVLIYKYINCVILAVGPVLARAKFSGTADGRDGDDDTANEGAVAGRAKYSAQWQRGNACLSVCLLFFCLSLCASVWIFVA
jgi:hypothetical protein